MNKSALLALLLAGLLLTAYAQNQSDNENENENENENQNQNQNDDNDNNNQPFYAFCNQQNQASMLVQFRWFSKNN